VAGETPLRKIILLALIASLAACGLKNNLAKPNGQPNAMTERDPSLPPNQTGNDARIIKFLVSFRFRNSKVPDIKN
jgi:predicted small lipoprotein YifL